MNPQSHLETGQPSVLEEIASRLEPVVGRPFPPVNLLHGYLFRPEPGRWRLYIFNSADYIEGTDADIGAMRSFLTLNGDTLVWAREEATLTGFLNGEQVMAKPPTYTTWHPPGPIWAGGLTDLER